MLRLVSCAMVLAALAVAAPAQSPAPAYPTKTVHMVVPFAPGGGTDVLARIVAQKLNEAWGQPFVIENQPGASGGIGTRGVMRAAPDGYTLLMASTGALMAAASGPGGSVVTDFDVTQHLVPVTLVAAPPYVITINPQVPADTVAALITLARERAGKNEPLTFGSSGVGAASHLTGELFQKDAGIKLQHVPYKGTGQAVNDLLGGQIDLMFAPPQTVQPLVEGGKLKALATTGPVRSPLFPALPTVAESGVPGFDSVGWFGLLAPPGTPAAVVTKINAAVVALLGQPDVREKLAALGAEPQPQTPEQFARYINDDVAKWSRLLRDIESKPVEGSKP
jgi:tripartite-type tricarboxylate transporter receptor subunit TctC